VSGIPRLTRVAGFELGSGMFINTVLPEAAAEYLRKRERGKITGSGAILCQPREADTANPENEVLEVRPENVFTS
jgi:hypothetical protein